MPFTLASERVTAADSSMSSALPAGEPSRISVSTTSARPLSTIRCAVVEPTNPPPTTVTFLRIQRLLQFRLETFSMCGGIAARFIFSRNLFCPAIPGDKQLLRRQLAVAPAALVGRHSGVHILDD